MNKFIHYLGFLSLLVIPVTFCGCGDKEKEALEDTSAVVQKADLIEQRSTSSEVQLIAEDDWPPYTIVKNGEVSGFAVEVVREMARRVNHSGEITPMVWTPAYNLLTKGTNVGVFCTARTAYREKSMKWIGPIFVNEGCLWKRKGSPIKIVKLESLKDVQIGVIRDTFMHQHLRNNGAGNFFYADYFKQQYDMLVNSRYDLMASTAANVHGYAEDNKEVFTEIEKAFVLQRIGGYLAFSKDISDETILQWQNALDSMKNDGSFTEIYHRMLPGQELPKDIAVPGLFKHNMIR